MQTQMQHLPLSIKCMSRPLNVKHSQMIFGQRSHFDSYVSKPPCLCHSCETETDTTSLVEFISLLIIILQALWRDFLFFLPNSYEVQLLRGKETLDSLNWNKRGRKRSWPFCCFETLIYKNSTFLHPLIPDQRAESEPDSNPVHYGGNSRKALRKSETSSHKRKGLEAQLLTYSPA